MQEFSTPYVGLDVHKESIDMALANGPRQAEVRHLGTVAGGVEAVSKAMRKLVSAGRMLHIVYEAGPCGFVLQRHCIQAQQPAPQRFGAGFAIGLAPNESAELGDHAYGLAQSRRGGVRGPLSVLGFVSDQHLALVVIEIHAGRQVRHLASELGHMVDAPGHHPVDGQAGLQPLAVPELSIFDPAAALQGAMKYLDPPAPGVPSYLLAGLLEAVHRQRREQCPFDGLGRRGGILFLRQHHLYFEWAELRSRVVRSRRKAQP